MVLKLYQTFIGGKLTHILSHVICLDRQNGSSQDSCPPFGRSDLRQPFAGTPAGAIADADELRAATPSFVFQPRFASGTIRGRPRKPLESWNRTWKSTPIGVSDCPPQFFQGKKSSNGPNSLNCGNPSSCVCPACRRASPV